MAKLVRFSLLLFLAFLTACSTIPTANARRSQANELAAAHNWHPETLATEYFDLVAYLPRQIKRGTTLVIYIEGDGFAWVTSSIPSLDPPPINPVSLKLALGQMEGNAVYLGRPCQYVDAERTQCPKRYWMGARFAPKVIEATNQAIGTLEALFGARQLLLVGYSGGATVAAWSLRAATT